MVELQAKNTEIYKNRKGRLPVVLAAFFIICTTIFVIIFTAQSNSTPETNFNSPDNSIAPIDTPALEPQPTRDIKILFTGDNMLALSIGERIKAGENIYANIRNDLLEYDFVVINLETNVSELGVGKANSAKNWRFNAPVEALDLLIQNKINVVNLANNHTMDYGATGLTNQISLLDSHGIKHFGAGSNEEQAFSPLILELLDTRIALLGFNDAETLYTNVKPDSPGTAHFDKTKTTTAIIDATNSSDIVIVSGHSGTEGSTKSNSRQREYYKLFIDSGADLIIGHHPHVMQEVAEHNGKMIYYSLGNFVFETGERLLYKKAIAVEVIIDSNEKSIKQINEVDVLLENGVPTLVQ